MLCNDFLNSLVEKITAHYGTIYLISFTNFVTLIFNVELLMVCKINFKHYPK